MQGLMRVSFGPKQSSARTARKVLRSARCFAFAASPAANNSRQDFPSSDITRNPADAKNMTAVAVQPTIRR